MLVTLRKLIVRVRFSSPAHGEVPGSGHEAGTWALISPEGGDVPVICPAAAAEDRESRKVLCEPGLAGREQVDIAFVELLGFVEFGVASGGGIGADSCDAEAPRAVVSQSPFDVGGVGAVDEEVVRRRGLVDCGDGVGDRGATRQPSV